RVGLTELNGSELLELSSGASELVAVLRGRGARVSRGGAADAVGMLGPERYDGAILGDRQDGAPEPFVEVRRALKHGGVLLVHEPAGGPLSLPARASVRRCL